MKERVQGILLFFFLVFGLSLARANILNKSTQNKRRSGVNVCMVFIFQCNFFPSLSTINDI